MSWCRFVTFASGSSHSCGPLVGCLCGMWFLRLVSLLDMFSFFVFVLDTACWDRVYDLVMIRCVVSFLFMRCLVSLPFPFFFFSSVRGRVFFLSWGGWCADPAVSILEALGVQIPL